MNRSKFQDWKPSIIENTNNMANNIDNINYMNNIIYINYVNDLNNIYVKTGISHNSLKNNNENILTKRSEETMLIMRRILKDEPILKTKFERRDLSTTFYKSCINILAEKTKIKDASTIILYPVVSKEYLTAITCLHNDFSKEFSKLCDVKLIKQFDFLVKMEKDLQKSIFELNNLYKDPNMLILNRGKRIYNLSGDINYNNHDYEIDEMSDNKSSKINGFEIHQLVQKRFGDFLEYIVEGLFAKIILNIIRFNVIAGNNTVDTYTVLESHFDRTEKVLTKIEKKFDNLNIYYNGKICQMDSQYMYLTYKVLFMAVITSEVIENFLKN